MIILQLLRFFNNLFGGLLIKFTLIVSFCCGTVIFLCDYCMAVHRPCIRVDISIQVEGAREVQLFGLKI